MDDLGLVEAIDGLGQRVVVAVADAAYGWLDTGFCQAFSVFDRHVLASHIAVVHQPGAIDRPPFMQSLLQRVEHEARVRRPWRTPTDDAPGVGIDDNGDVYEPRP